MTSSTGRTSREMREEGSHGAILIELLLVILIIAIMVTLAVPILSRTYRNMQLQSAAMNIKKLMVYGVEKARSDGLTYRLAFDNACKTYTLEVEAGALARSEGFTRVEGKPGRVNEIPPGISVKASRREITLYPDGKMDEAEVLITDQRGRGYILWTSGTTGRVEIAEKTER
jgi:Tfp pilus assembly protein FimT